MTSATFKQTETETTTLLRELVAEVRGLRADLARQQHGVVDGDRDERNAKLLIAIVEAEAIGERLFTSGELVHHANVVAGPLLAALQALDATTPRRLGKFLRRMEGRECGGWVVQRVGADAAGIIWKVANGL